MLIENSHRPENSKDRQNWAYVIFDKGEKEEKGTLDFKSENGWLTGNWGRVE